MRPSGILSRWLFEVLAQTFVEGTTLYVGMAQVAEGRLQMPADASVVGGVLRAAYSIADGNVYPICTKRKVDGPHVIYDNIETAYASTKDGCEPDVLTVRVLCVHKTYEEVMLLADKVEERLNNSYIPGLDACCEIVSRKMGYDDADGDYLEEFNIKVQL